MGIFEKSGVSRSVSSPTDPVLVRPPENANFQPKGYCYNTNRGALFRNDRKETDRDPDYNGELDVAGQTYWINGWLKPSKAGTKFMSVSVKPKQAVKPRPIPGRTDDDEIRW
jgi:hypothetical protein